MNTTERNKSKILAYNSESYECRNCDAGERGGKGCIKKHGYNCWLTERRYKIYLK
jgi:hypothetical protein